MRRMPLAVIAALCLAVSAAPFTAHAVEGGGSANVTGGASPLVSNQDEKSAQTVYLNGSSGSDANAGDEAAPVKTLSKALELAGGNGTIIVTGSVSVSETVDVHDVTIQRGDSFKSSLFWVSGTMTLTNVTIDGKNVATTTSARLLDIQNGGSVTMNDGTKLINNGDSAVTVSNEGSMFVMNGGLTSVPATSDAVVCSVTPHEWGAWTVTRNPSEDEEGSRTRTCSICGLAQTETIPAETDADESSTALPKTGDISLAATSLAAVGGLCAMVAARVSRRD